MYPQFEANIKYFALELVPRGYHGLEPHLNIAKMNQALKYKARKMQYTIHDIGW